MFDRLDGSVLVFRGEAIAYDGPCMPKAARADVLPGSPDHGSRVLADWEIEQVRIVSDARVERRVADASCDHLPINHIDWLALTQHQGGITRLLDVTLCWKVALYFAASKKFGVDGFVYGFFGGDVPQRTVSPHPSAIEVPLAQSIQSTIDPPADPIELRDGVAVRLELKEPNENQEAQNGQFLWWYPLGAPCPLQIAPIKVRAEAKKSILSDLQKEGICKETLFPAGTLADCPDVVDR